MITSPGAVAVRALRVNVKRVDPDTGERRRFTSVILPPWCRKYPKITPVLPVGVPARVSSGDFAGVDLPSRAWSVEPPVLARSR